MWKPYEPEYREGRVFVTVLLRRVSDGLEAVVEDTAGYESVDSAAFMWTEGNYSCDCNRHLFFERAFGNDPPLGGECSDGRYVVVEPDFLRDT